MKDQQGDEPETGTPANGAEFPAGTQGSRRFMLRGAAAALPTILTLHSGAALARSSNLLRITSGAPIDAQGRYLCVDETSVDKRDGAYDFGEPAQANVTAIPANREYRSQPKGSAKRVQATEICSKGGDYYYNDRGWKAVNVRKGGLVSATALASFATSAGVRINEI